MKGHIRALSTLSYTVTGIIVLSVTASIYTFFVGVIFLFSCCTCALLKAIPHSLRLCKEALRFFASRSCDNGWRTEWARIPCAYVQEGCHTELEVGKSHILHKLLQMTYMTSATRTSGVTSSTYFWPCLHVISTLTYILLLTGGSGLLADPLLSVLCTSSSDILDVSDARSEVLTLVSLKINFFWDGKLFDVSKGCSAFIFSVNQFETSLRVNSYKCCFHLPVIKEQNSKQSCFWNFGFWPHFPSSRYQMSLFSRFYFFLTQQPNVGQGRFNFEVSR